MARTNRQQERNKLSATGENVSEIQVRTRTCAALYSTLQVFVVLTSEYSQVRARVLLIYLFIYLFMRESLGARQSIESL